MEKVIEAIKRYKRFLITAHVNLEGDSIGSQLAMHDLLSRLGKDAFMLDSDSVPEHYKFLPRAGDISNRLDDQVHFDAALVLDCPTLKRTGRVKEIITKSKTKPVVNIDHHISNEKFGDINWVDPHASSTGEMIFRLYKEMNVSLTKEAALSLYIAILTDTGSFNYENTSSVTHEIAGELLGYGLDPARVSESVYERRSLEDIRLLALVLSTLKVNSTGEVAYLDITRKMLKETGSDISRSEGFINYARSIDKAKIAILFMEDPKDKKKISVSFRSKGEVDVNRIASYFSGGGHMKAAGCVIEGSLAAARNKVLAKVEETLKR